VQAQETGVFPPLVPVLFSKDSLAADGNDVEGGCCVRKNRRRDGSDSQKEMAQYLF
jgi:hypothetical protein